MRLRMLFYLITVSFIIFIFSTLLISVHPFIRDLHAYDYGYSGYNSTVLSGTFFPATNIFVHGSSSTDGNLNSLYGTLAGINISQNPLGGGLQIPGVDLNTGIIRRGSGYPGSIIATGAGEYITFGIVMPTGPPIPNTSLAVHHNTITTNKMANVVYS